MEYQLKSIPKAGIPEAIAKVELYRYLNEPEEAESICRDILSIDPLHQLARRFLGLAITDQYTGLLCERRAKAQLRAGHPPHTLVPLFDRALRCFADAEKIRPAGNDDSILRWNRCVRLLRSPGYDWESEIESFEAHDAPPR